MPTNETVTPTADLTETEVSKPAPEETETDAEPITFEDILSDPEFKAAYDRKVNQAINTYAKNHPAAAKAAETTPVQKLAAPTLESIDQLIETRLSEQTKAMRFDEALNKAMGTAGITDTVGYLAHIDLDDLYANFDPNKGVMDGYDSVEEQMRERYPGYFGNAGTGDSHGSFGSVGKNQKASTIRDALALKYHK